jgi:transcriptional regulator with XRE-family HTH domain
MEGLMLSPMLSKDLSEYAIGSKLHALRMRKKLGLVELGRHTGLSPALLSKLERGKLFPTLPTLLRIAMVFSVGLEHFFSQERDTRLLAIVRKRERKRFPDRPDSKDLSYYFESLDFPVKNPKLSAFIADFCPVQEKNRRPHLHAGVEFIHVLRGSLDLKIQNQDHTLNLGDSIYFDSSVMHSYRRAGSKPCTAIVVTAA